LSRFARIVAFGSAGVLVAAGAACAALVSGGLGPVLAMVLISIGLVLATSLVFLEVGLSEDRELARAARRAERARQAQSGTSATQRPRPRLGRMRGRRRRLK
jgi:hypothetical protein